MAEYIDLDEKIVVNDTRGREIKTTVRHILDTNKGKYEVADVRPVEWISVMERLPLLTTPVLATDGTEVDIAWMYGVPPRWITSFTAIDEDKLTHWMPLPQTPKGERGKP